MCSGKLYNRLNITLAEKTRRLKLETKRNSTSRLRLDTDYIRREELITYHRKNKHDKPSTQHRNLNGFIYAASILFFANITVCLEQVKQVENMKSLFTFFEQQ